MKYLTWRKVRNMAVSRSKWSHSIAKFIFFEITFIILTGAPPPPPWPPPPPPPPWLPPPKISYEIYTWNLFTHFLLLFLYRPLCNGFTLQWQKKWCRKKTERFKSSILLLRSTWYIYQKSISQIVISIFFRQLFHFKW